MRGEKFEDLSKAASGYNTYLFVLIDFEIQVHLR